MKCPECGFECLPDDVECLACGVHIAAAVENKEKERIRSLQAAERKVQYDIEFKKELGLIDEDEDEDIVKPLSNSTSLEETFKNVPKCPKCGLEKVEGTLECSRCGIIYNKYKFAGNSAGISHSKPEVQVEKTASDTISEASADIAKNKTTDPSYTIKTNDSIKSEIDETIESLEDIDLSDLAMESKDERLALMDENQTQKGFEAYDEDKTDEINLAGLHIEKDTVPVNVPDSTSYIETPSEDLAESEFVSESEDISESADTENESEVDSLPEDLVESGPTSESEEASETVGPENVRDPETLPKDLVDSQPVVKPEEDSVEHKSESDAVPPYEDQVEPDSVAVVEQELKTEELSENISDHLHDSEAFETTQIFESNPEIIKPVTVPDVSKSLPEATIEFQEPVDEIDADDKTEILSISKHSDGVYDIPEKRSKLSKYTEQLKSILKKTSGVSGKFIETALVMIKGVFGKLLENFSQDGKRTKIISVVIAVIFISVSTPFLINYYKTAKLERIERERVVELERIRVDFITNRSVITKSIMGVIDKKQFSAALHEINKYDISSLQAELLPLKNYLREVELYELVKKVPANKYEKNYSMFLELRALNPESELFKTKINFYKKKYAGSEYLKAKQYFKQKKQNIDTLTIALVSIKKAIELRPTIKKYRALDKKLKINKLMFYEGNENIVMAVRDDGMGKRLYSGQRKMTIWIQNISSEIVYINVQYVTMLGKNQKNYTYSDIGRKFKSKLLPGEQTRGELFFRTRTRPSKLVFKHLTSGEISRVFP